MNEDHAVSVFAMVKSGLGKSKSKSDKISNCKMTSISLKEANFSYVECKGTSGTGACTLKKTTFVFHPPLETMKDMRPRLVDLHHDLLTPKLNSFVTEIPCAVVLCVMLLFGYIIYFVDDLEQVIASNNLNLVESCITMLFGSTQFLEKLIRLSFIFAVVVHTLEACYGAFLSHKVLKLKLKSTLLWFLAISCVGYPMTSKVIEFSNVHVKSKESKEK